MIKLQSFTILCLFATLEAAKLPTYLTQCNQSDPELNACFKKNGNKAIPDVAKGDIHYDIPSAVPLRIRGPIMSKDNNQELIITELEIHSLESAKIENIYLNFTTGVFKMFFEIPSITALASCHAVGNYFQYTISNHEFLNVKFVGIKFYFNINFTISAIDNETFFTNLVYTENLQAQEQHNEFFPEFGSIRVHKTVCQERFSDIIKKQIGIYMFSIFKGISKRVPLSDIFLS